MKFSTSSLVCVLLVGGMVCAQSVRTEHAIQGIVLDQSGAVIPFASVALKRRTGADISVESTDEQRIFSFASVPPGSYQLEVKKQGFRTMTVPAKAGAASRQPIRIVMPVASVDEDVLMAASDSAAQVSIEIAQNQSGKVMDTNALDRIPLFDQDYITTMSRFLDPDSTGTNGTSLVVNGVEANGPGVIASAIQR